MKMKILFVLSLLLLIVFQGLSQDLNKKINLTYVVHSKDVQIQQFFKSFDLNRKELENAKKQFEKGNYKKAFTELCQYYKKSESLSLFQLPDKNKKDEILARADLILHDSLTFQSVTSSQKRKKDGRIEWDYLGPNTDKEWGYFVNRHSQFIDLLDAYLLSGDEKYVRFLNNQLLDWFLSNPVPKEKSESVVWRVLEAGLRMETWPKLFYLFQRSGSFTDACKILMLSQIIGHAQYLQNYHWVHHNHAVMEMNGLNNIAVFWPELAQADQIHQYALKTMNEEIGHEVLPDGVQNELSFIYHWVALDFFEKFADISILGGKEPNAGYMQRIESMYNYMAYALRPNGTGPLTGDSDLRDYREITRKAAQRFNRPDWLWIITNGKEGEKPTDGPSVIFPWAGYVITRSGWDKDAHWGIFDAGPTGASHRQADKLHLSVSAFGNDFLVDAGRYWYRYDIWRQYFLSSYSHNVILVDDMTQNLGAEQYDTPNEFFYSENDTFIVATDMYEDNYIGVNDNVRHIRSMIYIKGLFWVVVDKVIINKPHNIKTLWHFHPSNMLEVNENYTLAKNTNGNLLLKPISNSQGKAEYVKGLIKFNDTTVYHGWSLTKIEDFSLQGWHASSYNVKEPSPVAIYNQDIKYDKINAWLILPFQNNEVDIGNIETSMSIGDLDENVNISIRIGGKHYYITANLFTNMYSYE